jgi:HEAT repeat protein
MRANTAAIAFLVLLLASVATSQDEPKEDVQTRVAELIASMEESDYAGKAATEKLVAIGEPAVGQLLIALEHPKPRVRYWSAAAVARIGDERAFGPLVQLVRSDENTLVRSTALYYLKHYPRKQVWDLAIEMLDDENPDVRGWAIRLLSEQGRKEAVPKLRELALAHREFKTRYDAMVAVVKLLDDQSLDMLRTIREKDHEVTLRKGALSCLTILERKEPVILTLMIDALEDADAEVREFAAMLLRKGTNQEFPFEPSGGEEARAEAVKYWRRWYEANREKLTWDEAKRRFEVKAE